MLCCSLMNTFWRNFLITPINCTQFYLNFVVNFVHTRVPITSLVITSAYCFQKHNKFSVNQIRGYKHLLGSMAPSFLPTSLLNMQFVEDFIREGAPGPSKSDLETKQLPKNEQ